MKRVVLFGAVGYNLGDEAIAVAAAKYMRLVDPEFDVRIGTLKKGVISEHYADLKEFTINRRSPAGWLEIVRVIGSADVVVLGGGTLVQDRLGISPLRGMIPYAFQVLSVAKIFGKPVATLPIGVDELQTALGRFLAGRLLRAIDRLTVRDSVSRGLASAYGKLEVSEVTLSVDPAYLIGDAVEGRSWATDKGEPTWDLPPHYVAVSLVNEDAVNDDHIEALIDAFSWVLENTDLGVVLVPMDRRESEELRLFRIISARLGRGYGDRLRLLSPDANLFVVAHVIRRAELLVGMRLHAMILGVGHVPIVGISRTTKTDTFLSEFGLPLIQLNQLPVDGRLTELVRVAALADKGVGLGQDAVKMRQSRVEGAKRGLEELVAWVSDRRKAPDRA